MLSPPLKRLLSAPGSGAWPLVLLLAGGCFAPTDRPQPTSSVELRSDPFLVASTTGYTQVVEPAAAAALERAFQELLEGGSGAAAVAAAEELTADATAWAPATVLAAQGYYVDGDCLRAIDTLAEVVERYPGFTAAQLIVGHCRERAADLPGAAAAYVAVSGGNSLARARLSSIAPQARDAAVARIRSWLAGGRTEAARLALDSLQGWAPRDLATLSVVAELAAAIGDRALELATVRLLAKERPERALLVRQAALEMAVGDAGAGLQLLEDLRRDYPQDAAIVDSLEQARFAWRTTMLPGPARALGSKPELARGQWAQLLYWVFPGVRYARPAEAVIANDVLDHDCRTEIVRVVNLGIMEVDPNLHAFQPDSSAQRIDALRSLLRLLARDPRAQSCLGGATVGARLSVESACALSARCGLIEEVGDCVPTASLSGPVAMTLARKAARRLERQ